MSNLVNTAFNIISIALGEERMSETFLASLENCDWEALWGFAGMHKLTSTIACGIEKIAAANDSLIDEEVVEKWKTLAYQSVARTVQFDRERKEILEQLDREGIWYMPLKGVVLKELYPRLGMREMVDNDILYDKTYQEKVRDIFLSRGYHCEGYGTGHDDAYLKAPVLNFEMHNFLGEHDLGDNAFNDYYENPERIMKPDEDGSHGFHMSTEDFYIYMVAHDFKHYNYAGVGVRSLVDIYVYLAKYGDIMDWKYIEGEFSSMEMKNFAETIKSLSVKVLGEKFSDSITENLSAEENNMLDYMVQSGTYGRSEFNEKLAMKRAESGSRVFEDIDINAGISKEGKRRYMIRRVFPTKEALSETYKFCADHPHLWWLIHFKRFGTALTVNSRRITGEIKRFRKN